MEGKRNEKKKENKMKKEKKTKKNEKGKWKVNKAGYMATPVACGWAGAVIEVTRSFGQEQ